MSDLTAEQRTLAANTIRALSFDAVNKADSGHPGAPMGLADIAVVLWGELLQHDPSDPHWPDRDRFVLSNGHASMLLYSLLHLSGYDLSMKEIINFRQLHSKTPGHPEYGLTPGVETTTGPLGQGFANAVGMALGARMAKARFGDQISHTVWGICGDGCLMEGVTSEAASLAGHLGLGEIVMVFDDNKITIDGGTEIAFTEDVQKRFEAYGWHTVRCDGHDHADIKKALLAGKAETKRPTLVLARTHIGYGSPNRQDTSDAHGAPLGAEETKLTREKLGWTYAPFEVPDDARALFVAQADRGKAAHAKWKAAHADWKKKNPDGAKAWDAHWSRGLSAAATQAALDAVSGAGNTATRALSGKIINALAPHVPALVGGSADLGKSNKTDIKGSALVGAGEFGGRNIAFGVREHAMGAVVNGLALYGAFVPFGATFLTFSDYMRPTLRLAALMKIRALTVFTHESIYLGEDGPTHQAVEHAWALRLIPGLNVWRPADGLECAMAWTYAVGEGEPAPHALLFTRQGVAPIERADGFDPKTVHKGGYVLRDPKGARATIIATGSEVEVAVGAADSLAKDGIACRIVSMPCVDVFQRQDAAYRAAVLGDLPRASVELGRTGPWATFTGTDGLSLGVDTFGESAPIADLTEHFEMGPGHIAAKIKAWLA